MYSYTSQRKLRITGVGERERSLPPVRLDGVNLLVDVDVDGIIMLK
jgi:hypothetical protein